MAVSTYSALFNVKPKFVAPQTLVLDDAHAAEGTSPPTGRFALDRGRMSEAYRRLVMLLEPLLDARIAGILGDDAASRADRSVVELVAAPALVADRDALRELLETQLADSDQVYAWNAHVRDGLHACNLLVSWGEIVLRPAVPATARQQAFNGALQRVLHVRDARRRRRAGAHLRHAQDRAAARARRVAAALDGRRLFLMPSASLGREEVDDLVVDLVRRAGRALVLAPTRTAVAARRQQLEAAGIATLDSRDVEERLDAFTYA